MNQGDKVRWHGVGPFVFQEMTGQIKTAVVEAPDGFTFSVDTDSLELFDGRKRTWRDTDPVRVDRNEQIVSLLEKGEMTYQQIGEEFGITREYVRQLGKRYDVLGGRKEIRRAATQHGQWERITAGWVTVEEAWEIIDALPACVLCGQKRPPSRDNGTYLTCSKRCAVAWPKLRYLVDPKSHQKHRLAQAHTYLSNPDKYKPAHVDWAEKMLANDPSVAEANRRFVSARVAAMAKEFGIEIPPGVDISP